MEPEYIVGQDVSLAHTYLPREEYCELAVEAAVSH